MFPSCGYITAGGRCVAPRGHEGGHAVREYGQAGKDRRHGISAPPPGMERRSRGPAAPPDNARAPEAERLPQFTREESELWELLGEVCRRFGALPKLHPSDWPERTVELHSLQNALLSRPAYRDYLGPESLDERGAATIW